MGPTIWSGQIMEQILGAVKNEKISSGVLILLVAMAWYAHGWANGEFVKKDEFSKLQKTVTDGFESIEINDASQEIRDIKMKILITKATAGDTEGLDAELTAVKKYKACLVARSPNCKHLKVVE